MKKKYPYKIEVSYKRVFTIEAETEGEAKLQAEERACDDFIEACKEEKKAGYSAMRHLFNVEEWDAPTDWSKEAEEDGQAIASDIQKEIADAVAEWKKDNAEKVRELEENESMDISDEVAEIWDELYQSEDIVQRANEYADGKFIYNSNDAIIEALECMSELSEYEESDSGLWEGAKSPQDIINIQATYTMSNAILAEAEKAIRQKIAELLGQ